MKGYGKSHSGGMKGGKSEYPNKGGNAKGGSAGALNTPRATTHKSKGKG